MYTMTADAMRRHLDQFESTLRTASNSQMVRTIATNIATSFCDNLVIEKSHLPTIQLANGFGRPVPSSPLGRDATFDRAVDEFIAECRAAIVRCEAFEVRVAANAHLSPDDVKSLILEVLPDTRTYVFDGPLMDGLALSQKQVLDAFDELEADKLVEQERTRALGSHLGNRIKLTVDGRRTREGRKVNNSDKPAVSYVDNSTTHYHGPVANTGNATNVTQNNFMLPPLPPDVRGQLDPKLAAEYDHEVTSASPNRLTIGKVASAVKTLIEGSGVATELALHGNEWLHAVTQLVSTVPH